MLFLKPQIVVMMCFYVRVVCTLAISFTALGGSRNGTSGPMNHIGLVIGILPPVAGIFQDTHCVQKVSNDYAVH